MVPKIECLITTLSHAKYFTSMDLCKAYYQIPMSENASKISAFITPFGLYEWTRLSQGLVNAPACFQRIMETMFRDMNLVELIVFLDDILVHAETLQELEVRTLKVLERLRRFKLKLDPAKCVFGATEIKHLGYIFSQGTVRPDPDKVSAVKSWPKPTTVKEIKSIVGFGNVYRRFLPQFAQIVKPLNDLTAGYVPHKCRSKSKKTSPLGLSSDITHLWKEEHDKAFEDLKNALTSDLVLCIADKTKPFYLHCDASGTGIGAVLYQEVDGKLKVVSYASRGLNRSEQNYPAHKREFLALKWAMSDKYRDYLLGSKVVVVTDNNPLCYILKNAKLDATSHRWLASLSLFDFELRYKKGSTHIDADALSRRPHDCPEEDEEYKLELEKISFLVDKAKAFSDEPVDFVLVDQTSIHAILLAHSVHPIVHSCRQTVNCDHEIGEADEFDVRDDAYIPAVEQLVKDPSLIPDEVIDPNPPCSEEITRGDWRNWQLSVEGQEHCYCHSVYGTEKGNGSI